MGGQPFVDPCSGNHSDRFTIFLAQILGGSIIEVFKFDEDVIVNEVCTYTRDDDPFVAQLLEVLIDPGVQFVQLDQGVCDLAE